jgi:sugar fermentation stimulation protein A
MLGCSEPGRPVFLSISKNSQRKLPYSWELIQMDCGLVGINTSLPNKLAKLALISGLIPEIHRGKVESEVQVGSSRLDLRLTHPEPGKRTYLEVKNCTYVENGRGMFPDAVSLRATKHLEELIQIHQKGDVAVILILIQRPDADVFSPADSIDPVWGQTLRKAVKSGVKIIAREVVLSLEEAVLGPPVPIEI